MKKTRQMIMGMVSYEDFEGLDSGFINREEMELKVFGIEEVTIFLFYFLKYFKIQFVYLNILQHFQTLSNIYFQGKLVKVQQGGDRQATQTKEGGYKTT